MVDRTGEVHRDTHEVEIQLKVNMDGQGIYDLVIDGRTEESPRTLALFNHFLNQVARHGHQDISGTATCKDGLVHHLYEDTSLALGGAYRSAFGDKVGISRVSYLKWPFEGNVGEMAIDLSGRGYSDFESKDLERIDPLSYAMVYHVLQGLAREGGIDIYARTSGWDPHHQVELLGKLFGRTVYDATRRLEGYTEVPSTKGSL